VNIKDVGSVLVMARNAGAAARHAFRYFIRLKKLKRQPKSTADGFFEGVSAWPI
jgi:hypothetical protein